MKSAITAILVLALQSGFSEDLPCGATYGIHSIRSHVLVGASSYTNLNITQTRTFTQADIHSLPHLMDSIDYRLLQGWEGNCETDPKKKSYAYLERSSKASGFTNVVEDDYYVFMFSEVKINNTDYTGAFAWYDEPDVNSANKEIVVRKEEGGNFYQWYAVARLNDTVQNDDGRWVANGFRYFENLWNRIDSASLVDAVLQNWKADYPFTDKRKGKVSVHLMKVVYAAGQPKTVGIPDRHAQQQTKQPSFEFSQSGPLVSLHLGRDEDPGSVSIFNMTGARIRTLYPIGYSYQWDGTDAAGRSMPSGIYFVQRQGQVLGKFFYRSSER